MIKQQVNRIYNRVELRDPVVTDNPPTVPYMWLNGLTGELFTCTDNTTDLNNWWGQLGTVVPASLLLSPPDERILYSVAKVRSDETAIAFDGIDLFSSSFGTDLIYVHDGVTDTIQYTIPFHTEYCYSGLAAKDGYIYSADSVNNKIYKQNKSDGAYVSSFPIPNNACVGLFINEDGDMLSIDNQSHLAYMHNGISSSIQSSVNITSPYSSGHEFGICMHNGNLIIGDTSIDKLIVYDGFSNTIKKEIVMPYDCLYGIGMTVVDNHVLASVQYYGGIEAHKNELDS